MVDNVGQIGDMMAITSNRVPDIYTACDALEHSHSPTGFQAESWRWQVSRELETVCQSLEIQGAQLEGEGGLYSQVLADSPHLAASVERLRRRHRELGEQLNAALHEVCTESHAYDPGRLEALEAKVHDALCHATTFQRHVNDLNFDAYELDLGGPG